MVYLTIMRMSQTLCPTLKESPREAEIISHQLLLRAGFIKKTGSGLYTYLPMGLKVLRNIEKIIREEMDKSGALEVQLPAITPAEMWKASGRWEKYGKELLRIEDRHGNEFCYGPTFEEPITNLIDSAVQSYKQLPINLYQITSKFRDEIRPRFGLMRGREFMMKDAYSFHTTDESLNETYKLMEETYIKILKRCGLRFSIVEADNGAIGGSGSKEFMILADTGEDSIVRCTDCGYTANTETANVYYHTEKEINQENNVEKEYIETPGIKTIQDLSNFLNIPKKDIVKTLVYDIDETTIILLLRGDKEINEIKVKNHFKAETLVPSNDETVYRITGVKPGSVGPVNLKEACLIYADKSIQNIQTLIVGANKEDHHLKIPLHEKDFEIKEWIDIVNADTGDICDTCKKGTYEKQRGIEVGHIFKLGTTYTEKMNVKIQNEKGENKNIIMGCYGIGVSRIVAASIEQNHDHKGIIWPHALSPYRGVILISSMKDNTLIEAGEALYETLKNKDIDILLDDRSVSLGTKFKDAELIGIPTQIVIGKNYLTEGTYEVVKRNEGNKSVLNATEIIEYFTN